MVAANVESREQLVEVARTFYPEQEFGGKSYTALNELWEEYQTALERSRDDPPRYLG